MKNEIPTTLGYKEPPVIQENVSAENSYLYYRSTCRVLPSSNSTFDGHDYNSYTVLHTPSDVLPVSTQERNRRFNKQPSGVLLGWLPACAVTKRQLAFTESEAHAGTAPPSLDPYVEHAYFSETKHQRDLSFAYTHQMTMVPQANTQAKTAIVSNNQMYVSKARSCSSAANMVSFCSRAPGPTSSCHWCCSGHPPVSNPTRFAPRLRSYVAVPPRWSGDAPNECRESKKSLE